MRVLLTALLLCLASCQVEECIEDRLLKDNDITTKSFVSNGKESLGDECLREITFIKSAEIKSFLDENRNNSQIFVALNGQNTGIVFNINDLGCLGTLALVAAHHFDIPLFSQIGPFRFVSFTGLLINSYESFLDSDADHRVLFLLLKDELFIWPGVEIGYKIQIEGFNLITKSLKPKVILIERFISDNEIDNLISCGEPNFHGSPERHSSNDSKYHNYRTSMTASLPESDCKDALAIRKRAQFLTRLPHLDFVESLQLLKYAPGKWYKVHQDLFHNPLQPGKNANDNTKEQFRLWCFKWREIFSIFARKIFEKVDEKKTISYVEKVLLEVFSNQNHDLFPYEENTFLFKALNSFENNLVVFEENWLQNVLKLHENIAGNTSVVEVRDIVESIGLFYETFPSSIVEQNRFLTILPYLSDVTTGGGETAFPYADVPNSPDTITENVFGLEECELKSNRGLLVPARKGTAALFYHVTGNGQRDQRSSHAGCPTTSQEKFAINIFCWNLEWKDGLKLFI